MLKRAGFYEELKYGDKSSGSIYTAVRSDAYEFEHNIIRYLDNGNCLAAAPGILRDVFSKANEISCCGPYIYTDGVWEWPNELSFYVKKYHVWIPEDFLSHMIERKWVVRKLSENELIDLSNTGDS